MNKVLTTVLILIASFGVISCVQSNNDSPLSTPEQEYLDEQLKQQQAWDNLPIDYDTDEEFFNSTS